jgi:hypothetical protein
VPQESQEVAEVLQLRQLALQRAQVLALLLYWPGGQAETQVIPPKIKRSVAQVRHAPTLMQFPQGEVQAWQVGKPVLGCGPPKRPFPQLLTQVVPLRK